MSRFLFIPLRSETHNSYVVACTTSSECTVVDPPEEPAVVVDLLDGKNLTLRSILLTGGSDPGDQGTAALRTLRPDARLGAHPASGIPGPGDRELQHGDTLVLGRLRVSVLATPGERMGGISFHLPFGPGEAGSVLTGNALPAGGIAHTADAEERILLTESVCRNLFSLGDGVRVYPAYGPPSTIGVERHHNPCIE